MALRTGADSESVLARIRDFNRTNPEIAITNTSIVRSLGARARHSSKSEGGVMLNARLAVRVREAVGDLANRGYGVISTSFVIWSACKVGWMTICQELKYG